jgi:uncharacterized protein YegP (UPF0339 family)
MTFVFFICAIFLHFICDRAEAASKTGASDVGTPEEMIGLSVSLVHMDMYSACSFSLQDKNGETLFSCDFYTSEGHKFKFENISVPGEYMHRLRDLAKQHNFAQMKERDAPTYPDAPMYGTVMYWPDKKSLRLNYWPAQDELEKFFWDLADVCVNKPGVPEDISALYYTYVHDDDSDYFRFELCSQDGEYLFSARCFTENDDKVVFRDVPVDAANMQKLREIVKENDIVNMKGNTLFEGRSAPLSPYALLNIYWPDMRILKLKQPESGGEGLENFFRSLAEANSEHWDATHDPDLLSWLTYIHNSEDKAGSFIFDLREVNAATQLYAQCFTDKGEELDFFEYVDDEYMDQMREIVKKHGLVDLAKTKEQRQKKKSSADPYILNMDWSGEPGLSFIGKPPGAEELEKFFRSLAEKYK